jgi:hypothetical protein
LALAGLSMSKETINRGRGRRTVMRMRTLAVTAALLLSAAGTAMAQSGQGGYLGLNPGAHVYSSHVPPPAEFGSGQGGYLGKNAGANLPTPTQAPPAEFGSGEGGYLGMIPGADTGTSQAQSSTSTAHQLSNARVAE